MSRIEQLIAELCPDGVEYRTVNDVCKVSRGRVISKDFIRINHGNYPVYSSQTANDGILGTINSFDFDGEFLTWTTDGAYAGSVFYRNGKFSITNVCGLLEVKKNALHPRFLLYYLNIVAKKYVSEGMGNPKLMSNAMAKIPIPIPPLPIQQEIVRILDTFTDLDAELQAELEARKKQYEHYRNQLLNFEGKEVEWKSIVDCFELKNGYTPSKSKSEYWENGNIPWFRMEDIRKNGRILSDAIQHITPEAVKSKLFPSNSILLATTATIGEHALITVPSLANQQFTYITLRKSFESKINMKYFYYFMFIVDEWCKNNTNVSGFSSVDMAKFRKLLIPIPSLSEQERIVSILDKFEALVNDELPAEIDARRKQYEYYREKLLAFEPLVS
ncbi:MAG: restriction endonuclease subunit S [Proteiniphilum sp.]|nr:restriction endonuclease subunit S [Proteiniphilum sp.]